MWVQPPLLGSRFPGKPAEVEKQINNTQAGPSITTTTTISRTHQFLDLAAASNSTHHGDPNNKSF